MKYAIILLLLLLVGCTSAPVDEPEPVIEAPIEIVEEVVEETIAKIQADFDIEIVDGKLEPREISIPADTETTIAFHNIMTSNKRIDLQFQGRTTVTIEPNTYELVTFTSPSRPGRYAMDVDGQQIGTIIVG